MTASLKQLEGLQEELSEALAPSDVKQLSQKMWLLWQKHSDLKHKLSIRLYSHCYHVWTETFKSIDNEFAT